MLIGRKKEIEELKTLYSSNEAELVAVYGRRRVGKTFLINEVFKDKFAFVHSGLSPIEVLNSTSRASDQLLHFYHSLVSAGMKKKKNSIKLARGFLYVGNVLVFD